jgi:hypothetical protein
MFSDAASDRYSNTMLVWTDQREGNSDIYGTVPGFHRPMHLTAGEGFSGLVPVMWEPYFGQAEPDPFRIYRTDSQSSPFALMATVNPPDPWVPGRKFSWIDTTAENDSRYYYCVTVESPGLTGTSNIVAATPSAEGHSFSSLWARTAPVIDGRISDGEWDDAAVLDVSAEGAVHAVRFFAKNTGSMLYVAVDDSNDLFVESNTTLGITMDLDHNREWDAASPSGEGGLNMKPSGASFHALWGRYPGGLGADAPVQAGGIHYLALAGSGHVQHEAAIDLTASPLKAVPGGTIGFGVWILDPGNFYPAQYGNAGQWPAGMILTAAQTLGSMTLAMETDASGGAPQKPEFFRLEQNYPNPFNPETTIRFTLKESCQVTLKVCDILGNEAAVLADRLYPAGNHAVRFNAAGMPSGLYVVRMRAGGYRAERKMTVIK